MRLSMVRGMKSRHSHVNQAQQFPVSSLKKDLFYTSYVSAGIRSLPCSKPIVRRRAPLGRPEWEEMEGRPESPSQPIEKIDSAPGFGRLTQPRFRSRRQMSKGNFFGL